MNHPVFSRESRSFWLAGAVLAAAGGAWAEEPTRLEPVEVSASRLESLRRNTRGAVTAFEGGRVEALGVGEFADLAPLVPGLFVSAQSPESVSYVLRGVGSDVGDYLEQPRVSVFQDGVALAGGRGNSVALFDQDEVAVFKGPQTTAFGRGAQTGALALTSKRAEQVSEGALRVGAGDFGARELEASVNRPVVEDKLAVRVAVRASERDGYVRNLADGSDLQGEGTVAARMSVRWRPTPATTGDLIVNFQRDDVPGTAFKSGVIPVSPLSTDTSPYTPANLNRGAELGATRTIAGLTGILRHELGEAWVLTATSGWRRVDSEHEFDADGSFLYLLELGEKVAGRQLSQEVRLDYDAGERFKTTVGVNVAWAEEAQMLTARTDENVLWSFLTMTPPPFALNPRYMEQHRNDGETLAGDVFGRTEFEVTERLTVGGGLRVTQERLTAGYQSFAAPTAGTLPAALLPTSGGGNNFFQVTGGRLEQTAEVSSWSGQVDARYEVTPRLTAFAVVSRGRRPPVMDFNRLTLAPERRAEETIKNFEAGLRGSSAGGRVRHEVSAFQYYFDNFQTQRVVAPGVFAPFDGGRARGRGVEATVEASVARGLSVFASYGFTDAEFSALGEDGQPQAYAGNTFRLTSRHTASVGGTVEAGAGGRGTVYFTPVFAYRSAYFFEDDNAQNGGRLRQGGHGVLNARLGYRQKGGRWQVEAYVNNVLEKEYLLDAGNVGGGYGVPTFVRAAPRLVGVNATVRF